ncbi:hypothetical protein ABWH97_13845 [Nitratireductor sp. ac15]
MSGILEYSTTPSSNTTINSIGIQGTSAVNNFDNAFRQMMADVASSVTRHVTKSANYTAVKTDNAQLIEFTAAATLSLTAAATLTNGWSCIVKANGGDVLIDPSSSEQIDGASTKTIKDGSFAFVFCTGTAFVSLEAAQIDAYTKTQSDARYATAAQGILAQNALPKSGGDLSGHTDMANAQFYRGKDTGGTGRTLIGMWNDDKIYVGATGVPMQLRGTSINAENLVASGVAKAWVNFKGDGTVSIRDSFNVSSITDNGNGDYTVNFSSAMANANYSVAANCKSTGNWFNNLVSLGTDTDQYNTVGFRIRAFNVAGNLGDQRTITAIVMGQ